MTTIVELNHQLDPLFEYGLRRRFGSANVTFPLSAEMLQRTAENLERITSNPAVRSHFGPVVVAIEVFPNQAIQRKGLREAPFAIQETTVNPVDLSHSMRDRKTSYNNHGSHYDVVGCNAWDAPSIDLQIAEYMKSLLGDYRTAWGKNDNTASGMYLNIEVDRVRPEAAYGANLVALEMIKKMHDPDDLFWKPNGINGSEPTSKRHSGKRDRTSFGSASLGPPLLASQIRQSRKDAKDESTGFFSFDDHFSPKPEPSEDEIQPSSKQGRWRQIADQIRGSLLGLTAKGTNVADGDKPKEDALGN